jgi:hypothetical protein
VIHIHGTEFEWIFSFVFVDAYDDITITIIIDITNPGHLVVVYVRAGRFAIGTPRGSTGKPGGTPSINISASLFSNHDVSVSVSVHIARPRDRKAKVLILYVTLDPPVGGGGQSGGRAIVDEHSSFFRLAVRIVIGPDNDIIVPVSVDVTRAGNGIAET